MTGATQRRRQTLLADAGVRKVPKSQLFATCLVAQAHGCEVHVVQGGPRDARRLPADPVPSCAVVRQNMRGEPRTAERALRQHHNSVTKRCAAVVHWLERAQVVSQQQVGTVRLEVEAQRAE